MENAISYLNVLPQTKEEIKSFASKVKESYLLGEENPLKLHIQLKSFEILLKTIKDDKEIKEAILNEVEKYGAKNFEDFGAKISITERGTYDYSNCNHSEYNELLKELSELTEKKKKIELMLQSIDRPVGDADTGEIINPAQKKSNTIISITLN